MTAHPIEPEAPFLEQRGEAWILWRVEF